MHVRLLMARHFDQPKTMAAAGAFGRLLNPRQSTVCLAILAKSIVPYRSGTHGDVRDADIDERLRNGD